MIGFHEFHGIKCYLLACETSRKIMYPSTIDHAEVESAETVSKMTTRETECVANYVIHTAAAIDAVRKVSIPIFSRFRSKKAVPIISIDTG